MGRPRQGQTGNGTRPRRRSPAPTTRRRPLATRRTHPPRARGSLGSAALRSLLGAEGARRPPHPGTHPSVDTPRHPIHGPHAPPRGRHRLPAPHLAHGPARLPAGGRGSASPHDQASVPAEGPRPNVQARRPSRPRTPRVCTGPRTRTAAPGRTSPTGTTRCPAPPRCAEAQGPHTGQTRAKAKCQPKSWTKEEAAALYPEYAIGTRLQLPFEYATAAGPSKWIWAAGEVKHQYLVPRDHQGFKIHVKWDPATPNDKKLGRTIKLWRDRTGREMVPMQLCNPDTEHLGGTEYTGEVHNAWALPQPQKRNRKAPAAQGFIDLLDA